MKNRTSEDMRIDRLVYHFPFFQNVVTEKFFATLILDSNNKTDDNIITLNNLYPLYEVHLNLVINDDVVTCDTGLFNTDFIINNREKYISNSNSDLNIFLNVNYIGDKEIKFNLNSLFMYYYNNGIKPYCNIKIYYVGNIEYGYNKKEFLAICDNLEIVKVC